MNLGEFQFADTAGVKAYADFVAKINPGNTAILSDLTFSNNGWKRNQIYQSYGLNISIGAASLEYNLYRANKKTLTSTIGISLKIPILYLFYYFKKKVYILFSI